RNAHRNPEDRHPVYLLWPLAIRRAGFARSRPSQQDHQKRRSAMQSTNRVCATALVGALLLMPAANAQQPVTPSTTSPDSTTTTTTISDKKLDAAAAAIKGVSDVSETYEQKLAEAPVSEKQRLVDEANIAMAKAVIDQGL